MYEPLHILVIDDDKADRTQVRRAFKGMGVSCSEAEDYASGLNLLKHQSFDCVFIDYLLPDRDGLELLAEIRALGYTCPLIILTGQGDEQKAVQFMKAGASDYITKASLSPDSLGQVLRSAMRIYQAEETTRQAIQSLRDSEERYRLILEGSNDGIWDWDFQTGRTFLNDRCLEILGVAHHSFGGKPIEFYRLIVPEDRRLVRKAFKLHLKYRVECAIEFRLRRADGQIRYCFCRGQSLYNNQEQLIRMTGILSDISERKCFEVEREQLLENERQARQEAENASRLKDEFLATVSHELRTPLSAIQGWTQLLQQGRLERDAASRALDTIERNARVQNQLIEDLLDVSWMVAGKMRLQISTISLNHIIQEAIESLSPAAFAKNISLVCQLNQSNRPLLGDPNRLQQVAWNLLSNAIKFTPAGGEVFISLNFTLNNAVIIVKDNGQGIPPKLLPLIFERFRQLDGSKTRQHGGLGLGLAIVRNLVELHGGTVDVISEGLGKGSTFTVHLPLPKPTP
jgi:PAS domain S-box-containing protein